MCVNGCVLTRVRRLGAKCCTYMSLCVDVDVIVCVCVRATNNFTDLVAQVVFTALCNFVVTFPTSKTAVSSQDVASSLPPQTQLRSIVAAVWSTMMNPEQTFPVVVECQKLLLSVTHCDQGIYALYMYVCLISTTFCSATLKAVATFVNAFGVLDPVRLLPSVKGTLMSFMKRLIEALK